MNKNVGTWAVLHDIFQVNFVCYAYSMCLEYYIELHALFFEVLKIHARINSVLETEFPYYSHIIVASIK